MNAPNVRNGPGTCRLAIRSPDGRVVMRGRGSVEWKRRKMRDMGLRLTASRSCASCRR